MDEDEDEEYETGYILAAIRHREPFHQFMERYVVDNCGPVCLFSTRLRMNCHRTKQESQSGFGERTQTGTLR